MTKIIGTELDYTTEQLDYFEAEMRKYKLPWITKMHKKYGVPFIRFAILPIILVVATLGIIYNASAYGHNDWMWTVDKAIAFFLIFGFGGFTLLSFILEKVTTNKLRKRLGLSKKDFAILIIAFQITGM
jgi:TctA family transporter